MGGSRGLGGDFGRCSHVSMAHGRRGCHKGVTLPADREGTCAGRTGVPVNEEVRLPKERPNPEGRGCPAVGNPGQRAASSSALAHLPGPVGAVAAFVVKAKIKYGCLRDGCFRAAAMFLLSCAEVLRRPFGPSYCLTVDEDARKLATHPPFTDSVKEDTPDVPEMLAGMATTWALKPKLTDFYLMDLYSFLCLSQRSTQSQPGFCIICQCSPSWGLLQVSRM